MQKAKIKIKINDYIIEETGTLNNEVIKVKTNEEAIQFNMKKLVLKKENKDLKIELDFINKTVLYELEEENKKFSNNLVIFSLTNSSKHVIINYQIEHADFLLEINYETIQ